MELVTAQTVAVLGAMLCKVVGKRVGCCQVERSPLHLWALVAAALLPKDKSHEKQQRQLPPIPPPYKP